MGNRLLLQFYFHFFLIFGGHQSFFGATDIRFGILVMSALGFKARWIPSLACLCHFCTIESSDSPLVRHLLTFWQPLANLYLILNFVWKCRLFIGVKVGLHMGVWACRKVFTLECWNWTKDKVMWWKGPSHECFKCKKGHHTWMLKLNQGVTSHICAVLHFLIFFSISTRFCLESISRFRSTFNHNIVYMSYGRQLSDM